jgi:hypothetical protein
MYSVGTAVGAPVGRVGDGVGEVGEGVGNVQMTKVPTPQ